MFSMTVEALNNAKVESLTKENQSLQQTLVAFSGQLRARKQTMDELYDANVNLRSTNFLLDDATKSLQKDIRSLTERVETLEKEKSDLQARLDACAMVGENAA